VERLEIQRPGADPKHNSTTHVCLLSSAIVVTREANGPKALILRPKITNVFFFQGMPQHYKVILSW